MKAYYYLLYRLYIFYIEKMKEEQMPLIYVASISTLLVFINLFTLYGLLNYYDVIPMFPNKYFIIAIIILLWTLNYFLFVRKKRFLLYNFRQDFHGGAIIVCYVIITALSFIVAANYNREKIFSSKKDLLINSNERK
jgi:hypothetical protein